MANYTTDIWMVPAGDGMGFRKADGTEIEYTAAQVESVLATGTGLGLTADAAELNVLDGVTAGTVAASKGVVVDANKDIGDFRNIDAVNIDAGASGTAGSVDVFPATASKGKLAITVTNQTGNTTVGLNINAMGQATTVNVPDPGAAASYVVQSTAALTLAEVDVLDAVTPGTVTAGKAVVTTTGKVVDELDITSLKIGTVAVTATAAEINELASRENVFAKTVTATIAEINAGKAIIAAASGVTLKVLNFTILATGAISGGAGTGVLLQSTADVPEVAATIAKAAFTDGAYIMPATANVTLGAGFATAPLTAAKGLSVIKSGDDFDAGTSITITVTYSLV